MPADLRAAILEAINSVQDPCSLAQAIPIGLSDMGLVTGVELSEPAADGRRDVRLTLRVTAPGCFYMPFMDSSIRAALGELADVGEVSTRWDPDADWSPSEIAPSARMRIERSRADRRRTLESRAARRAGSPA
jgi:metal-sulfur cluster biosynthetic enzyme